jgi:hypothetical protein
MAGTGLDPQTAARRGLVKNHWMWRVLVSGAAGLTGQIVFGFNVAPAPSIASGAGQHAGSSRVDSGSDYAGSKVGSEVEVYSEVGSKGSLPL